MAKPSLPPYTMADLGRGVRRKAPAAARNLPHIEAVLREWLPARGLVLEVSSGTGEHALAYSRAFPNLDWQPTDRDPAALASIAAWAEEGPANLRPPLLLDAAARHWPVDGAEAILNINMVHIAPPAAGAGLIRGASRLLSAGAPLILYGPWLSDSIETAPSNLAFDADLKARNPEWGLRRVEDFAADSAALGLDLVERRAMPANNLMLLLRRR